MTETPFISICILSYNRPETLLRLLKTIDTTYKNDIEVVISDDFSPRREEIRKVVDIFSTKVSYSICLNLNEKNLGYDKNFNNLVKIARGRWLVFMGDDDEFVPHAFDKIFQFLKSNDNLGYVMKSHLLVHEDGQTEKFRYLKNTTFFDPGCDAYLKLFRRSVFIAGFMIRRDYAVPYVTDRFDGSMLMQLYMLAEVVLRYPSAYFDEPFTLQYASHSHNEKDVMYDRTNDKFIPRRPTIDISISFLKSFLEISKYIDRSHGIDFADSIRRDMSKYFYPNLAVHRSEGVIHFCRYVLALRKTGFDCTIFYYVYVLALLFLGKSNCDHIIFKLKNWFGYTPQL